MNSTIKQIYFKDGAAYAGDALLAIVTQREERLFRIEYFFDGELIGKNFSESSMENAIEIVKRKWDIFLRKISNVQIVQAE